MSTITTRSAKGSPLTNSEVDSNFTNLDTDKYESGNSAVLDNITSTGELTLSASTSVSASGTVQGDATALTKTHNIVTTATTNQGVVLPAGATGKVCHVTNLTANDIKVYPAAGGTINTGSANVPKTLTAYATMTLVATSGAAWQTLVSFIIYDSSGNRLN